MSTTYYKAYITSVGRSLDGPDTQGSEISSEEIVKPTLESLIATLEERYEHCLGKPNAVTSMMCDHKTAGDTIGIVFCFENADWSHAPVEKWAQEDWVSITKIIEETVTPPCFGHWVSESEQALNDLIEH